MRPWARTCQNHHTVGLLLVVASGLGHIIVPLWDVLERLAIREVVGKDGSSCIARIERREACKLLLPGRVLEMRKFGDRKDWQRLSGGGVALGRRKNMMCAVTNGDREGGILSTRVRNAR